MSSLPEAIQYKHPAHIPGLTLSTARFSDYQFEPHYHLDCHIGLVTQGVQRQSYRGDSLVLSRGSIQLMPPGEVHDGTTEVDGSYTLQTFRLSPELLDSLGQEITGKHQFPSQAATLVQDSQLADRLLQMHATLQQATVALPTGQAFALLEGNRLYKLRIPLADPTDDMHIPASLKAVCEDMRSRYRTSEQWWKENDWFSDADVTLPIATPIFVPTELDAQMAQGQENVEPEADMPVLASLRDLGTTASGETLDDGDGDQI